MAITNPITKVNVHKVRATIPFILPVLFFDLKSMIAQTSIPAENKIPTSGIAVQTQRPHVIAIKPLGVGTCFK